MPSLNISGTCDPCGPRRRVSTIRQISTFRSRTGMVSGSRDSISATGKPSIASKPPAGTHAGGSRAAVGIDAHDQQLRADEANIEARVAAEIDGRRGRAVAARWDDGEMRQPETTEHVADDVAKLTIGLRAGGTRSELGLDCRPVQAVHRGIEVRVADDGPGRVERLAAT